VRCRRCPPRAPASDSMRRCRPPIMSGGRGFSGSAAAKASRFSTPGSVSRKTRWQYQLRQRRTPCKSGPPHSTVRAAALGGSNGKTRLGVVRPAANPRRGPSSSRPLVSTSTVAASFASAAGWRKSLSSTSVARRSRTVTAPAATSAGNGANCFAEVILGDQRVEPDGLGPCERSPATPRVRL